MDKVVGERWQMQARESILGYIERWHPKAGKSSGRPANVFSSSFDLLESVPEAKSLDIGHEKQFAPVVSKC